jgi:hypothetical protein
MVRAGGFFFFGWYAGCKAELGLLGARLKIRLDWERYHVRKREDIGSEKEGGG